MWCKRSWRRQPPLRWDDVDFRTSKLHVRRAKGGTASVHPLRAKELRALRRLLRETPEVQRATYLFVSERMAPLSVAGYQRMVARAGKVAGFGFLVHSHMLRHSTGYKLANDGHDTRAIQDYLGHKSIASTVRYTALAPDRFKHFWRDWGSATRPSRGTQCRLLSDAPTRRNAGRARADRPTPQAIRRWSLI